MKASKNSKRTVWIIIVAVLAVILCGLLALTVHFSSGDTAETTVPTTTAPAETTTAPVETTTAPVETTVPETTVPETTVPPTTEPVETEPPFLSYNPLTGEGLYEVSEDRPFAVVFNNIKAAQPQYGVGEADILCEILVEGTTRCLGIFYDFDGVTTFGSIRSARPYLVSLAQSFDAIFVHAGRSEECQTYLNTTGWDHIDGVHGSNAGKYYYRDQARKDAGYALEHTMFIKPENVVAYAKKMGCTMTRSGGVSYGWEFTQEPMSAQGETANKITHYFNLGSKGVTSSKSTTMEYNAEDGLYYAYQYGSAYKDAGSGKQLSFRNVLILKASTVSQGDSSGHLTITLTGSGTGYYACDGKLIPIQWSRSSASKPFTFTLEDGTVLNLAEGKTYMGFITGKGVVNYE